MNSFFSPLLCFVLGLISTSATLFQEGVCQATVTRGANTNPFCNAPLEAQIDISEISKQNGTCPGGHCSFTVNIITIRGICNDATETGVGRMRLWNNGLGAHIGSGEWEFSNLGSFTWDCDTSSDTSKTFYFGLEMFDFASWSFVQMFSDYPTNKEPYGAIVNIKCHTCLN